MGDEVVIGFRGKFFHFTAAFKQPSLMDNQDWGQDVPVEFSRRMELDPGGRIEISFHAAADDDRVNPDLAFDDRRLANNQSPAFEISPSNLPSSRNRPWKVIFPSKEVSLPRKALISSGMAGSFDPLFEKRDFAPDIRVLLLAYSVRLKLSLK